MMKLASAARWAMAASLVMHLVAFETGTAAAQSAPGDRKQAEEALRAGLAAQKSRKHADAVGLFTQAIDSGALGRKELTLALYRRAVSHRAEKRPAQAISDLNSALYFADSLSSADKSGALKERERAYGDAGLAAPPQLTPGAATASASAPASAGEATSPAGNRPKAVAPRVSLSNLPPTTPILGTGPVPAETPRRASTTTGRGQAAATATVAPASVPAFATRVRAEPAGRRAGQSSGSQSSGSQSSAGQSSAGRAPVAAAPSGGGGWSVATQSAAAASTPAASAWNSSTDRQPGGEPAAGSNPVSTFFSNLFGGGSVSGAEAKPVVTGAVPSAAARPPRPVRDATSVGTTDWAATARAAPTRAAPTRAASARAASKPASTVKAATPPSRATPVAPTRRVASADGAAAAGGAAGFDIAVATVRSKDRAEALAKQLTVQYSGSLSWTGKSARVDTFPATADRAALYSVRLGTYSDKGALASQCEKLIADGLECQVIRRK